MSLSFNSRLHFPTPPSPHGQIEWHSESEHAINGRLYAGEMQFVHANADGRRAVVAVLLELGEASDPNLALAAGAKTIKMFQGHRGANHPVQRVGGDWGETEDLVEITSMNHGFAVDGESLPDGVVETHRSLFDGSNCGIAITGKQAFGVQYHPEASPGPQDSFYLFEKFVGMLG